MSENSSDGKKAMFICYKFTMPDGGMKEFNLRLDCENLELISEAKDTYPDWTQLEHCQCPNCPLKSQTHPYCPIAKNLVALIDFFKDTLSFEETDVEITTETRTYSKRTAFQNGIFSLMGIYMTTSGCPIMDKLRPMVRTHLPFASMEETTYRAISMYLMAQYFLLKRGKQPDWQLEKLAQTYDDIQIVNKSFFKRIAALKPQDASLNAVVHLDCFARFTNLSLREKGLAEIERLFHAYF